MNQKNLRKVGYVGYSGENNLGDEAFYHAINRNSQAVDLAPSRYTTEASMTLLAGGTVIPHVFNENSVYYFQNRETNIALGVGVAEPEFVNQHSSLIGVRWLCRKRGVSADVLFDTKSIGRLIKNAHTKAPSMFRDDIYMDDSIFEQVSNKLDLITVRGPKSQDILKQYGIESEVVGDTGLLLEPDQYYPNSKNKVVITLRDPHEGPKWHNGSEYINHIVKFCNDLPGSVEKMFLPFSPEDIKLHKQVSDRVTNAEWRDYTTFSDINGILSEIASAEIMIGEKLHASVFSACCHTPFISLEYAPKNEDFAASVNMEEFNVRVDQIDADHLKSLYYSATEMNPQQLREPVSEYRTRLKNTLSSLNKD
jgi:hypothetical protein